jgi:LPS export ABC transporter protein LptC
MSLKNLATVVVAILLVAAVGGAMLYVRRQTSSPETTGPAPPPRPKAEEPAVKVEEFAPEHYEQGRPAWKIRLADLAVEKGGETITSSRLREGLIYDREGRPAVRVTASTVQYDTGKHNFDVSGGCHVVSPRGAVINTEKIHWDNATRMLTAPGSVTVRVKGVTITASGLRFDTSTQTVYCPNQVRLNTGRSDGVGRNLTYNLDTGRWSLHSAQMVIDVEEARERTGTQ